jgi:O-antigen ligase
MGLLVWLPLPVGSNRPIWIAIALTWVLVILMGCVVAWMTGRHNAPMAFFAATGAWWLLGLFLIWQLIQLFLFFPTGWHLAPGFVLTAFEQAGSETARLNTDWASGLSALWQSLLVMGVFLATVLLVYSHNRVRRLLWTIVWVGLVLSVVTGVYVMEKLDQPFLGLSLTQYGWASGSFINRNHFANYLVLTLCSGIGLLITMQSSHRSDHWKQRLRDWIQTLLGPKARLRVFLALVVITLVLTRSRMGNMSFFLSLLISGSLALYLIRGRQRSLMLLIGSLVAIDILIIGSWFGVEQVVERIQQTVTVKEQSVQIHAQDRLGAFRETMAVIRQVPLTGTGGGSYYSLFPHIRTPDQKFLDHAHNDYVEFTVEYGIPASLLLAAFVLLTLWKSVGQLLRRRDAVALGASFATLMAIVAMGLHATVDFNLHIPANAATFMVLLALPWVVSVRRRNI